MKKNILYIIFIILFLSNIAFSKNHLDFTFHKLDSDNSNGKTLLVVGGIQGNEPGGFNAAAILITQYKIKKGNVWVVPNLNFISIINRSRGVYGDLNRKFNNLKRSDPEYKTIKRIKDIILNEKVDMVVNLHDGSGFYRRKYIDAMHCPRRWGQSVVIDRKSLKNIDYGALHNIAKSVVFNVNKHLFSPEHRYDIKNTNTHLGDKEMEKTLTYFAICNKKPSFGLEVSKSFSTPIRSYYHLRLLESFMDILNIKYERNFPMNARGIKKAINSNVKVVFYDNKILLDMQNIRNKLSYVPLKKNANIDFSSTNPLLAIVSSKKKYKIYHGNRRLSWIHPEYFEYDSSINKISMKIDGNKKNINFGNMITVDKSFMVLPHKGYRINVIGFKRPGIKNETGISISKNDISKRFSVDKKGKVFRVEVYKNKKFSGMVLVNFEKKLT